MSKLLLGSIALVALMAGPAMAADMRAPVSKAPPPAPAPVWNWTGFYIGANGGYAWRNRSVSFNPADSATAGVFNVIDDSTVPNANFDIRGGFGGFQLGYNWQFDPRWVAGLETDLDLGDIKGSGTSSNVISVGPFGSTSAIAAASEKIKWFGTVRGRLGVLVTNEVLLYGTGGFAYGRVEQSATYTINSGALSVTSPPFSFVCVAGTPCFVGSSSRVQSGWTAGGGAEWALWYGLTFKAEYLYVNLRDNSFPMSAIATTAGGPTPSSFRVGFSNSDFRSVRVGLNYRFGVGPIVAKY
jgi:outer membrane immunogenic protein